MRFEKYLRAPYLLLVILAALMLFNSFLGRGGLFLPSHGTYFVISGFHVNMIVAMVVFGIWLIYIAANRLLLSRLLTKIHIYSLVAFLGCWLVFDQVGWPQAKLSNTPLTYYEAQKVIRNWYDVFYLLFGLIFLLGSVCFIANLAIGLIRLVKRK